MKKLFTLPKMACLVGLLGFAMNSEAQLNCNTVPNPTISMPTPGELLSSTTTGVSGYLWFRAGDQANTLSTQRSFSPSGPGGYVVGYIVSNCTQYSIGVYNYQCSFDYQITYNGFTASLVSADPVRPNTYQWKILVIPPKGSPNPVAYQNINGANSSTYTATQVGSYRVSYQTTNGCVADVDVYIDGTLITGLSDDASQPFAHILSPNPVKDILHVSGNAEIFTLAGTKVMEGSDKLYISTLENGVYLVKTQGKVMKMIKE